MADAPKFTEEQLAEIRERTLIGVTLMEREELTLSRSNCVSGTIKEVKTDIEQEYGKGSFPPVEEYCRIAVKTAIDKNLEPGLYIDLAIQQLGLGTGFDFKEQGELIGNKPATLLRNIRAAADGGYSSYVDAADKERPLNCPLAFDAGATWASANKDRVDRPYLTEAQAEKIASICHIPDITDVTIGETGKSMTIQQAGLAAGEILGQKWKTDIETASIAPTGAITTGSIPIPEPAPRAKQAKAVGG